MTQKSVIVLEPSTQFVDSSEESSQPYIVCDVTFQPDCSIAGYSEDIAR